jgi:hypothetical protein
VVVLGGADRDHERDEVVLSGVAGAGAGGLLPVEEQLGTFLYWCVDERCGEPPVELAGGGASGRTALVRLW